MTVDPFVADTLVGAIRGLIRSYADKHPGTLSLYARANRSVVPEVVREYQHLLTNPILRATAHGMFPAVRRHGTQLVEQVVESLQGEPGELGSVTRTYPAWVRSELLLLIDEVGRRL